jgi:hypothetical protein
MTETPASIQSLLRLGIGLIVAVYVLSLVYAMIFFGTLEVRAVVRIVMALGLGWLALRRKRWAGWVLTALALSWTAEQMMWGLRGALDSFLAAFGFLAGFVVLLTYMLQSRVSN